MDPGGRDDRMFGSWTMFFSPKSASVRRSCVFFRAGKVVAAGQIAVLLALAGSVAAQAGASYEFVPAPAANLNRIYRIDRATGEVGACQYGLTEGSAGIGVTLCYPPGEGAGPQGSSEYSLIASRHTGEGGIFRVDLRTGAMSVCYVLNEAVVCTQQAK
jgi:hypothetical protein